MDIQDVDVVRSELLQRRLDGEKHRLDVIACVLRFLADLGRGPLEVRRILRPKTGGQSLPR